jgi:hypothetical protein
MSINYVPTWGIVESIRELFQNARDAETANPKNKMYFNYDAEAEILRVGNKDGHLETKSLLLGQTSKLGDNRMIGQHGEGYKVATVVLLRNGKGVKVYNRSEKEVWTAKIVKSRRYQADVVVYDVEKVSIFKSVPDQDLIFEVTGISQDEYDAIVESNLYLQDLNPNDVLQAGESRVLTDEAHRGRLYVGGLYVTTSKYAKLGYDFEPTLITLDRDRSFIDGLDLQFICGKVLCATNNVDVVRKYKDIWDGAYIRWYLDGRIPSSDIEKLYSEAYSDFIKKNGADAVPCTDTNEFNFLKRNGYNAIMVSQNEYHYITHCSTYSGVETEEETNGELAEKLQSWFEIYIKEDSEAYEKGKLLIEAIVDRLS